MLFAVLTLAFETAYAYPNDLSALGNKDLWKKTMRRTAMRGEPGNIEYWHCDGSFLYSGVKFVFRYFPDYQDLYKKQNTGNNQATYQPCFNHTHRQNSRYNYKIPLLKWQIIPGLNNSKPFFFVNMFQNSLSVMPTRYKFKAICFSSFNSDFTL